MKNRIIALMLSASMLLAQFPVYAESGQAGKVVSGTVAAHTANSAFARELERQYIDPDRVYSSDVRWWLGSASATDETLLEEIQALYDGGFRGVELCMQSDGGGWGAAPPGSSDNKIYAYGSKMWSHKWKLMMNKLLDLGMGVYLTSGTNWSTSNVPESTLDPASQEAMQILAMPNYQDKKNPAEKLIVKAGETITDIPLQTPSTVRKNCKLEGVFAYEIDEKGDFFYDSFKDLLKEGAVKAKAAVISDTEPGEDATAYTLTWTAPTDGKQGANGRYFVIPLWSQGSYQTSSPGAETCYATNYFDTRGVDVLRRFWEKNYLSDAELNEKIKKGDVQLFMDSLEINYGAGFTWWCEDALEQFKTRKGYDIFPYLFLVSGVGSGFDQAGNPYYPTAGTYKLAGEDVGRGEKIINDWQDVMTQLYEERMLVPLKEWLNGIGIKTRAQISYGKPFEITEPSQYVDYPEAENLNQYNQIDVFRLHTAGAKLLNRVLSTETGAEAGIYGKSTQGLLHDAYTEYAAGFQRVIWHIWTADFGYQNFAWPGYVSGMNSFYRWSNRNPSSRDYDELNSHMGRIQQLMQTGKARTDLGFVYNNWAQGIAFGGEKNMDWMGAHQGVYYRSTELQDHGYTYDYFSPKFLFNDEVKFNPETKTLEGAGYRALVLFQAWLDPKGAQKLLELAKQGMPVVVVDGAAVQSTFNNDADEAKLAEVMAELKKQPTVRVAAVEDPVDYAKADKGGYYDEVYDKLQELGVRPYAEFAGANHQLLTQSRMDDQGNMYLYAYNYCDNAYHKNSSKLEVRKEDHGTNIQTEIKMDGRYIPYSIDAWTGRVTELAQYRYEDGQTVIPVDLDYDHIALYAFEKASEEKLSVVSTNAASSYAGADGPVIRALKTGKYTTELSNGNTCISNIQVAPSYDIENWDVTVESWTANEEKGDLVRKEVIDGQETINKKTSTVKTPISVKMDKLATWDNVEAVGRNVSGLGRYEATFSWDAEKASGAYLDLGDELEDTIKVWINGKKVGGNYSANPTKAQKSVGVAIDDGKGNRSVPEGKQQYSGGINWFAPTADIGEYLVNGENRIVMEYSTSLTNAALAQDVIKEQENAGSWRGNDVTYRSYGPSQAKIVPYVDQQADVDDRSEQLYKEQEKVDEAQKAADEAQKKADAAAAEAKRATAELNEIRAGAADNSVALQEAQKKAEAAQKAAETERAKAEAAKKQVTALKNKVAKLEFQTKKITLSSAKSSVKKKVTVKWKKVAGASGYQVQMATSKKFKGKKTVTIKKGKTTSKTVAGLKSGKKYYVRIRAYKTIAGKKAYSKYSAVKQVKIK